MAVQMNYVKKPVIQWFRHKAIIYRRDSNTNHGRHNGDDRGKMVAVVWWISLDYFCMRKPLERRLYGLARKCCGTKNKEWKFTLGTLRDRTGSKSSPSEFRRLIEGIIEDSAHIPDYRFELRGGTVHIYPKERFTDKYTRKVLPSAVDKIRLKPGTYQTAERFVPKLDIYGIEDDWRRMLGQKGEGVPEKPDGSFIAYAKWYVKEHDSSGKQLSMFEST